MDLKELKNIHKDQRSFILGNGRSLLQHNLLHLRNEKVFCNNHFPLHTQFKDIKPNFYCFEDVWELWNGYTGFNGNDWGRKLFDILLDSPSMIKFFPLEHKQKLSQMFPQHLLYFLSPKDSIILDNPVRKDILGGVTVGGSIIGDYCFPLAYYMGFTTIFLLGCDFEYTIEADFQLNHFLGPMPKASWITQYSLEGWFDNQRKQMLIAFNLWKETFETEGRKIYNAGRGGKLELFERIDYDSLF